MLLRDLGAVHLVLLGQLFSAAADRMLAGAASPKGSVRTGLAAFSGVHSHRVGRGSHFLATRTFHKLLRILTAWLLTFFKARDPKEVSRKLQQPPQPGLQRCTLPLVLLFILGSDSLSPAHTQEERKLALPLERKSMR